MDDVNRYIDNEVLQNLYKGLEPVQYSRVACAIRIKVLQCLKELLPQQEPPDFYERVLQSFNQLAANFDIVCRQEPHIPGPPCDEVTTFLRTLQTCALTTEQLQLTYFRELCRISSPVCMRFKIEVGVRTILFSWKPRRTMVRSFFVRPVRWSVDW